VTLSAVLKNLVLLALLAILMPHVVGVARQLGSLAPIDNGSRVAVIEVRGAITDSSCYIKQLRTHFKAADTKAILLKFDCPGGAQGAGEALFNELQFFKREYHKPVVALVENFCTSAGYLIASAADAIVASPSAVVGSIGTVLPNQFQLHDFLTQHQIGYATIKAGDYKMAGNMLVPMTPENEAHLQGVVDDAYEQLVQMVAAQRRLSPDTRDAWANGRIFTGMRAKQIGLIDAVGSLQTAAGILRQKAFIDGEIDWVEESCVPFWQCLLGMPSKGWKIPHSLLAPLFGCFAQRYGGLE